MTDDIEDLLAGLDAPVPLGDALRARLEAELLAPVPLEDAHRSALHAQLVRRPRRRLLPVAGGLSAAAGLVVAAVLLSGPSTPAPPTALPSLAPSPSALATPAPTPSRAPARAADGGTTGGGLSFQGRKAADASPTPLTPAAAPVPPPATAPQLDEVLPAVAYAGAEVEVRGRGLADPVEVRFGSAVAEVVASTETVVRVRVPAGTGSVDVVVETAGGSSNAVRFTYRD